MGSSDVWFLDLSRHVGVFSWRKFIKLYNDDSVLYCIYICYTSVKMLKMKLSNQQSLGASNFYLNRKPAIVLVMEHSCLGGSACACACSISWKSLFFQSHGHSLACQPILPHGTSCYLKLFTCRVLPLHCPQGSCLWFTAACLAPRSMPGT